MEITVSHAQGQAPVTILHTHGPVDASNYAGLVAKAQELYKAGTRDLLLDLSDTNHISSSGIVALHLISMVMRGESLPDSESSGWESARAIDRDLDKGMQKHFKLFNTSPNIDRVLSMVGFKQFLEVHTDLDAAVASFA